ncbi:hypothetical protein IFM89_019750 [Coptis chinensis]|uniref:Eukaryotic translation initiation factor 3 subunit C N-terminal domain-containing protein n=1 Tax=Coptis chinensis TaxID=261450 RepID=A0A835H9Q7_9MAGN|nr:hypothetical protein IFM89_019750 [Coptis chinensis]
MEGRRQMPYHLYRNLEFLDVRNAAYKEMLRCEPVFFLLSQSVLDYLQQRRNDFGAAAIVAFRMLEVLYYKPHEAYDAMRKHVQQSEDRAADVYWWPTTSVNFKHVHHHPTFPDNCRELMDELLALINKHGDERTKHRAMIFDIYHHAINDEFSKSRDLLLLGLCAFRAGFISEAHSYLSELYADGNVKELLYQGVSDSKFQGKTSKRVDYRSYYIFFKTKHTIYSVA